MTLVTFKTSRTPLKNISGEKSTNCSLSVVEAVPFVSRVPPVPLGGQVPKEFVGEEDRRAGRVEQDRD